MTPITTTGLSYSQIARHPVETCKIEWRGGDSMANCYIQVWDTANGPTDPSAVLLKVYQSNQSAYDYKEFKRGDMTCSMGMFIGLSNTESAYVAVSGGGNILAMLSVELLRPENPVSTSYAGDLTSAVTGLQVWSEAAGAATKYNLVALEVDGTNLTGGGIQYIQIFATDAQSVGDIPISSFPIASGGSVVNINGLSIQSVMIGKAALRFGPRGIDSLSADKPNPTITYHYGCTVQISSTARTYTPCTGTATIKAEYNTSQI